MLKALKLLLECENVLEIRILEWKQTECVFYAKIEVHFNEYILHIREYENTCTSDRKYSYHLQNAEGNLIIRFDNAPHYKNVETFPHHIHMGEEIQPSSEITPEDIIEKILKIIESGGLKT